MIAGQFLMNDGFYWRERSCFGAVGKSEIKKLPMEPIVANGYYLTKDFFGEKLVVVSRLKVALTTTRNRDKRPSDALLGGLKSSPLAYFVSTEGFF